MSSNKELDLSEKECRRVAKMVKKLTVFTKATTDDESTYEVDKQPITLEKNCNRKRGFNFF